jgi:hypothetical protein
LEILEKFLARSTTISLEKTLLKWRAEMRISGN